MTESDGVSKKRPAFQFYPGDWMRSADLRSCSVAARGLWIEMLCLMHDGNPYGHLRVGDRVIGVQQLARMVGSTLKEAQICIAELVESGVCSVADDGCFYSRRMVRDEQVRNARIEGGKAGSEHGIKGAEHGIKGGRPKKGRGDKKPPLEPPSITPLEPPPAFAFAFASSSSIQDSSSLRSDEYTDAKKSRPVSRGSRLPADWSPSTADAEFLQSTRPDLTLAVVAAEFLDYWIAQPGQRGVKTDWPATWRNWVRRQAKVNGRNGSHHLKPTMGDAIRRSDELTRDWVPSEFQQ